VHAFTAVIERYPDTQFYVGYVLGFRGAYGELRANLQEVISTLLDEVKPKLEAEFVGTQTVVVD
jgi:hypothetical protein